MFCPATQSRPPLFIGATLYKTRSKIILKISIFGKLDFISDILCLILIDFYWVLVWLNGAGKLYFDYLKALKIAIILCILVLIVVCLGFYLDFWELDLWDLMIYWFLVGIFGGVGFDTLVEIVWFLSEW